MSRGKLALLLFSIARGNVWLAQASRGCPLADRFTPQQRKYWAFQKVRRPRIPAVKDGRWVRNPIDAFLADHSPRAYENVVDRLLALPHYGERWARHWLDLARYAESEGFKSDETRPNPGRYRDSVIRSLNADKPFDRFIKEQIAGDELWPADPNARIATGFNRHYPGEIQTATVKPPVERRCHVHDLHATILHLMGLDHLRLTYFHNGRFERPTINSGEVIQEALA